MPGRRRVTQFVAAATALAVALLAGLIGQGCSGGKTTFRVPETTTVRV